MKLKTLEYFITLAESRSINEAAQKLYIAQPSLTKSLQLFEEEVGCRLFYRDKAGIRLTEAGKKVLPEAKQIVSYYNGWLTLSQQCALRVVNIYIQHSFPNFLLPEVILNFKKRHPDIQVSCQLCPTPEQYISQDIEQPALTLFVCGAKNPIENYSKLQGNPPMILFHGAYRCLTNSQSSLAGRNCVTPEDLKHRFCVLRSSAEARTPVISALLDWLSPVVPPEQFIRSESVESIIKMAETHDDVYALSYYPILNRYEGIHTGKLISIPFADDCGDGELCLFYSKRACQRHPELRELVDEIYKSSQSFMEETGD